MNKKIIAFGALNSIRSINKKLAVFTANRLTEVEITILDLTNFELPIYSFNLEINQVSRKMLFDFQN